MSRLLIPMDWYFCVLWQCLFISSWLLLNEKNKPVVQILLYSQLLKLPILYISFTIISLLFKENLYENSLFKEDINFLIFSLIRPSIQ